MSEFALIVQLAVGIVFLRSFFGKLTSIKSFVHGIREFELVPNTLLYPAGIFICGLEGAIGASHLSGWQLHIALPASVLILFVFLFVVSSALFHNKSVNCLCYDNDDSEKISLRTILRLAILICAEVFLWIHSSATPPLSIPFDLPTSQLFLAFLCAGMSLVAVSYLLMLDVLLDLRVYCSKCKRDPRILAIK